MWSDPDAPPAPSLEEALQTLAEFATRHSDEELAALATQPESVVGTIGGRPALMSAPPAEMVVDFMKMAYEIRWVSVRFAWTAWHTTPEARRLLRSLEELAHASVDDLIRVVTTVVRADRFCEGAVRGYLLSGLHIHLAARARAILQDLRAGRGHVVTLLGAREAGDDQV